jgi:hypothetical protein
LFLLLQESRNEAFSYPVVSLLSTMSQLKKLERRLRRQARRQHPPRGGPTFQTADAVAGAETTAGPKVEVKHEVKRTEVDVVSSVLLAVKKCPGPNCDAWIQKMGGCNHVRCSRCKTKWCWQCDKPKASGKRTEATTTTDFKATCSDKSHDSH